jgi:EmrB/QacA subfamily drug resistance transporter
MPPEDDIRPMETAPKTIQDNDNPQKWWVFLAIGIGTFMSALDSSVVNTILPVIRTFFNSNVAMVEWTVVVYLLVVSSLLLFFGRLGDLRGHKIIYVAGFIIFVISSAACGFAPTVGFLIAARGVQSIGAAMLFANAPAILTQNFPPSQRGRALGMQAMMTYLGLTAGPSLGGWLTQSLGWRSVFYINVPIGLIAFTLSVIFIAPDRGKASDEPFDWAGAGLFSVGLLALMLGLNQGSAWGWNSPAILGCLVGAVVLLGIFLWYEGQISAPMLHLGLFAERVFSASAASAVMNYICLYSVTFLLPFYLIQGRGLGTAQAGLILSAQPIIMAISAPISGSLSDKIGSRLLSTLGMGILMVGLFLLSRVNATSPTAQILVSLGLCGLGTGVFISPNNSALMGSAPRRHQGIAAGILATARNVGMVLGIGMAGAILTSITAGGGAGGSDSSLFTAVQTGLLAASGVAAIGAFTSSLRGNGRGDGHDSDHGNGKDRV